MGILRGERQNRQFAFAGVVRVLAAHRSACSHHVVYGNPPITAKHSELPISCDLDEAFRLLAALEDARLALRERGAAPGLQDELATVIRVLHGKLGLDEGGVL